MLQQTHVALLNLGTPQAATLPEVKRFMREFLADPRVIDIATPLRWLLVNGFLLPFRSKKTTAAYQQIWQTAGSPLLLHSQQLQSALATELGNSYEVHLAMRYGQPSMEQLVNQLRAAQCRQLIIFPLYPQYASASTGTALEKILQLLSSSNNIPAIHMLNDFYDHPLFIDAYANVIKQHLDTFAFDKLLFSYHGIPERHIDNSGCQRQHCHRETECPQPSGEQSYCYRQQCFATSRLIAQALQLNHNQYQVAFQSRLGKLPWIGPYTDTLLPELFKQGVRNLAVACPSFICDCLETLEEIGIRAQEQWRQLGGQEFTLIPCLNAQPFWVSALAKMVINIEPSHPNPLPQAVRGNKRSSA